MALNPDLIKVNDCLIPANKGSEFTYMKKESIKLKLYLPDRTIKENGSLFLTSIRMVFIKNEKSKTNENFKAVEFPLNLIEKINFEQPVFGMNYLSGVVKLLNDNLNNIRSDCKWNLVFTDGNSSKFLSIFFKVYEDAKHNKNIMNYNESEFFANGNAYVDPNNPMYLYINEPVNTNMYQPQNVSQNHYVPLNNSMYNHPKYMNNQNINPMQHPMQNPVPNQMSNQMQHQMPNQMQHQMPNQMQHQMPNQMPHQIPNQIQYNSVNPMQHPMQNPMQQYNSVNPSVYPNNVNPNVYNSGYNQPNLTSTNQRCPYSGNNKNAYNNNI